MKCAFALLFFVSMNKRRKSLREKKNRNLCIAKNANLIRIVSFNRMLNFKIVQNNCISAPSNEMDSVMLWHICIASTQLMMDFINNSDVFCFVFTS